MTLGRFPQLYRPSWRCRRVIGVDPVAWREAATSVWAIASRAALLLIAAILLRWWLR